MRANVFYIYIYIYIYIYTLVLKCKKEDSPHTMYAYRDTYTCIHTPVQPLYFMLILYYYDDIAVFQSRYWLAEVRTLCLRIL
jgi:hypothetical protein